MITEVFEEIGGNGLGNFGNQNTGKIPYRLKIIGFDFLNI